MNGKEKFRRKRKLIEDNGKDEVSLDEDESPVSRKKAKEKCLNEKDDACAYGSNAAATKKETDYLQRILRKEVPWEGYSPLHNTFTGKKFGVLEKLIEMGYVRNIGKWMPEEIEQLNQNVIEFVKEHDVKDLESLIYSRTKDDQSFRRKTQFVLKVSRGISRTCNDVKDRLYTQFATFFKKGSFSKEEILELKRLHNIYGNKWKNIGLRLNRCHRSLSGTYRNNAKDFNRGTWTSSEEKSLLTSVIDFFEKNERVLWQTVSNDVGTKSPSQCWSYWRGKFSYVRSKDAYDKWLMKSKKDRNDEEKIPFSNKDLLKLLNLISAENVDDEYLIDWNDLVKHFDHMMSPAWLKWKFQAVCKEVPHSHRLILEDILEQLVEIYEKKVEEGEAEEIQVLD